MRFISKVTAKILSDRERVKQQQKSKDDIKDSLRRDKNRGTVRFSGDHDRPESEFDRVGKNLRRLSDKLDDADERKKPEYDVKNNKVIVPKAFKQKVDLAVDQQNKKKLKELLKGEKWVNPDALESMINRLGHAENGKWLLDLIGKSHHEPYIGDTHSIQWRTTEKSEVESKLPHPIPQKVNDLKGTLGKDVPVGGSDPFMMLDSKYSVTKNVLEKHKGKPLTINTRSDLISHDDYLEAMDKKNHKIRMHVLFDDSSTDDKSWFPIASTMEAGAPSTRRRLMAVKKLADKGYDVTLVVDKLENPRMPRELTEHFLTPMTARRLVPKGVKVVENKVKISDAILSKMLERTGLAPGKKASGD